ncbi:MAG: hypothetical protein KF869_01445 [Phycisphaeraceae bacterium]|nr:hypothetical protein [Phycisphaeraceae bacterium]
MMFRSAVAAVLPACMFCGLASAQSTPTPPAPADPKPAPAQPAAEPKAEPPKGDALPSLDDLLGLGEGPGEDDAEKAQLDKLLSGQEIGQAFQQAVALMGDAAKRLTESRDVGLATQRVQEDALRKLDQLISSLDRQSQQQQQQSQSQQQDDPQNSPRQRQQQQQQQQQQQAAGSDPQESDGPTLQEGGLNPLLDSARAAWGALPARVREMLMQGSADRFSALYNKRTQEYYRRLAEESTGGQ